MFRSLFVLSLLAIGVRYAVKGPFYVLLLYLGLAYFRPEEWVWTDFITPLRLSYTVGIWLVLSTLLSKNDRFTMGTGTGLLLLFTLHSLISTLLSSTSDYAWRYWQEFGRIALVSYFIVVLVTTEDRLRWALIIVAVALGFEGSKQGWAQLVLNPGARNDNTSLLLGDNNGVGIGMLVVVSLLTTLAKGAPRLERYGYWFLTIGTIYRALSTYSRGAFLSCITLFLQFVIRSKHKIIKTVAVLAIGITLGQVLPDSFWARMRTIQSTAEDRSEADASSAGRLHFWAVAIDMANESPLFGVGHNSYQRHYDRFDNLGGAFGRGRSPHSIWFGLVAELGYGGLFIFLALLFRCWWTCLRVISQRHLPGMNGLAEYAAGIEGALLVVVVGGTFFPFQYNELLWHLFAFAIAIEKIADRKLTAGAPPVPSTSTPAASTPLGRINLRTLPSA